LLLDEPTTNLDINYQVEVLQFLHDLCRKHNFTVVTVLHDLNLASQFCDRLIMLKDGHIWKMGNVADVIEQHAIKEVFGAEVLVYLHPVNGLPTALLSIQSDKTDE